MSKILGTSIRVRVYQTSSKLEFRSIMELTWMSDLDSEIHSEETGEKRNPLNDFETDEDGSNVGVEIVGPMTRCHVRNDAGGSGCLVHLFMTGIALSHEPLSTREFFLL